MRMTRRGTRRRRPSSIERPKWMAMITARRQKMPGLAWSMSAKLALAPIVAKKNSISTLPSLNEPAKTSSCVTVGFGFASDCFGRRDRTEAVPKPTRGATSEMKAKDQAGMHSQFAMESPRKQDREAAVKEKSRLFEVTSGFAPFTEELARPRAPSAAAAALTGIAIRTIK
mmetsp:Transcript_27095/g.57423  ORF Transcript_27095/g.57423 Transcript_27095/m.57423 type:complete len:171 (-) Transcript_27095:64-576(-)